MPGPEHHFLINPYGKLFEEITASNLVKIDLDGRKVEDTPHISAIDLCPCLVRDFGDNNFLMLRNHGLLTVADNVPDAFLFMYLFQAPRRADPS